MGTITKLLDSHRAGSPDALDRLLQEIYPSIRGLASRLIRKESSIRTLQPTALAHEFVVSLLTGSGAKLANRGHLMAIAALQMRHIIARHATRRRARFVALAADPTDHSEPGYDPALATTLEIALRRLEEHDPRAARVVELKFYGGLSGDEIAAELGVTRKTVQRDWSFASAWLSVEIGRR